MFEPSGPRNETARHWRHRAGSDRIGDLESIRHRHEQRRQAHRGRSHLYPAGRIRAAVHVSCAADGERGEA